MAVSSLDPVSGIESEWAGRRVTLMGLGRHGGGLGAARFLVERGARLTISELADPHTLAESLDALAGLPIHALKFGGHDENDFSTAGCVVVNPAVRPDHPCVQVARAAGAVMTSEIELFLRHCPARVIGVTGSNGKSTTAAMLAEILAAAGRRTWLGGNIGTSLLGRLERMRGEDWVVLELSSFQLAHLGDNAPPPEMAVITNCTPNHLDWHGSFAHYAASKRRIVRSADTLAVVNPRDPVTSTWPIAGRTCSSWPLSALGPLAIGGEHNRHNAALAAAAAEAAGVRRSIIRRCLASFRGLQHRLQLVAEVASRRFYNDSKATTPQATGAALAALEGPLWLLAGGVSKGANFDELAGQVVRRACGAAVFGSSGESLRASLAARRAGFRTVRCDSLAEAFDWCWRQSRAGDAVLLSPACASYDQFRDFEARGAAFCELVQTLSARLAINDRGASCQPIRRWLT
jgi:UDP-N-acetylmuramoylalanine--D-glutamate ligase